MKYKEILNELIILRNKLEHTSCDDSVDLYRKIDELIVDELNSKGDYHG
tara:strand:+ start:197 stop:343 length:147 start_codon:yes stop_codon:yes gene_type:complete